ncbi:MAG: class E sortase [Gordonia sp. (in: high G+C Gram-positive bacteria)]|uniref:class E sortase n=1 Tax=Gordonia TaxID=2053 RepID=UPI003265C419
MSDHHAAAPSVAPSRPRPGAGQILGELLLTAGVLVLLFVVYEAFWTNIASGRLQAGVESRLEQAWSDGSGVVAGQPIPPLTPVPGEGFARIHMPAIDIKYAVVEGVDGENLRAGPGHYPASQLPGEPGNFALAAHRIGSGAAFQHLDGLEACDAVVVETEYQWLTYRVLPLATDPAARAAAARNCLSPAQTARVTDGDYAHLQGRRITLPGDVDVINPLPSAPWTAPGDDLESVATLTTCHPLFSNTERMIVHAMLVETIPKSSGGRPAALQER